MENCKNLKSFAIFLLEEGRLREAVFLNIQAARNHQNSIIDKLGQLSEEEIVEIFTQSLGSFLQAIAKNKGFDNIFDSFKQWKKNNYNIPSAQIQASDIMLAYEIRRDVLIELIPTYTSDMAKIKEELEALFFIARMTGMRYVRNIN